MYCVWHGRSLRGPARRGRERHGRAWRGRAQQYLVPMHFFLLYVSNRFIQIIRRRLTKSFKIHLAETFVKVNLSADTTFDICPFS